MKTFYKQAQIEFEIEKNKLGMTTTKVGDLFERAQAKIQSAQARRDLMARIRQALETMEEAAEAAERSGGAERRRGSEPAAAFGDGGIEEGSTQPEAMAGMTNIAGRAVLPSAAPGS